MAVLGEQHARVWKSKWRRIESENEAYQSNANSNACTKRERIVLAAFSSRVQRELAVISTRSTGEPETYSL